MQAVAAAWREMARYPSVVRYDAWRGGRSQFPVAATARRFVRSWDDLLGDAYSLVYPLGEPDARATTAWPDRSERETLYDLVPTAPAR